MSNISKQVNKTNLANHLEKPESTSYERKIENRKSDCTFYKGDKKSKDETKS